MKRGYLPQSKSAASPLKQVFICSAPKHPPSSNCAECSECFSCSNSPFKCTGPKQTHGGLAI